MFLHRFSAVLFIATVALCAPAFLSAQDSSGLKAEVFSGYSGYRAGGTVNGVKVPEFTDGWAGQVIFNTGRSTGFVVDVSGHYNGFGSAHDLAFGPRFQRPIWRFVPFTEALLGVQHFSPKGLASQNTATYIFGAGIDVKVNPRFSIRPLQISYVSTNYSDISSGSQQDNFNGVRVQTGLVYRLGLPSPEGEVIAACSAEPSAVDAGGAVKIAVTPKGFLSGRRLRYSYVTTGGVVAGNTPSESVDTTGLAPGTYTISAKVMDNGRRKHQQTASCQTTFNINAKHTPVLSVSADTVQLKSGDALTITASASSQDNRPLTYNCSASGGQLTGTGPSYTLNTTGVPDGKITVNCTVNDDRNLSASASTSVEVSAPASVIQPPTVSVTRPPSKFGDIEFKHDLKRPTRVDNEAKAELDRYADALLATQDANGVVVGYAASEEETDGKKILNIAGQRSVNTKDYLNTGRGVDPARIEARTGSGDEQKTELWIVPVGTTFAVANTAVVDETKLKAVPRIPLKARKTHQKTHSKARQ